MAWRQIGIFVARIWKHLEKALTLCAQATKAVTANAALVALPVLSVVRRPLIWKLGPNVEAGPLLGSWALTWKLGRYLEAGP